jgi:hypothetical protein
MGTTALTPHGMARRRLNDRFRLSSKSIISSQYNTQHLETCFFVFLIAHCISYSFLPPIHPQKKIMELTMKHEAKKVAWVILLLKSSDSDDFFQESGEGCPEKGWEGRVVLGKGGAEVKSRNAGIRLGSHSHSLFFFFQDRVLWNYLPMLALNCDPPDLCLLYS